LNFTVKKSSKDAMETTHVKFFYILLPFALQITAISVYGRATYHNAFIFDLILKIK